MRFLNQDKSELECMRERGGLMSMPHSKKVKYNLYIYKKEPELVLLSVTFKEICKPKWL